MKDNFELKDKNEFIKENINFVLNTATFVCKRRVDTANDEEVSVALEAFSKAYDTFNENKGNFFTYAKAIIRNSLIDFFRKSKNVPHLYFEEETQALIDNDISITNYEKEMESKSRLEEISAFRQELLEYGIDFLNLSENSPSHSDTREELLNVAIQCIGDEKIINSLIETKKLPIASIISKTEKKRKFLEKWRRYLITLILLLRSEEYIYIKSYLNIVARRNSNE